MNQPDGSLKLYPPFSTSRCSPTGRLDSVRTRRNWIGAIYYRIIEKTWQGPQLLYAAGLRRLQRDQQQEMDGSADLYNPGGEPQFGGPFFSSFVQDSVHKPIQYRFNIEYKKEAGTRFNYDPQMDMVVYDHLVPEGGPSRKKKDTYIPDGDFEAFQWKDGRWVHVTKQLFSFKLKDGEFPMEAKMLDDEGKANELQLQQGVGEERPEEKG